MPWLSLENWIRSWGQVNSQTVQTMDFLVNVSRDQGDLSRAEALLLDAHDVGKQNACDDDGQSGVIVNLLVRLYEVWGKPDRAPEFRAMQEIEPE